MLPPEMPILVVQLVNAGVGVVLVFVLLDRPHTAPFTVDDRTAGYWCDLSMRQVEHQGGPTKAYANNGCEADHGRLKARMRPMRELKTDPTMKVITAGHAFIQNVRRGHYELGVGVTKTFRLAAAFDELAATI